MGPIALFDKSFLQSLSLDESVWFDNFFIPNVCPMFYLETLGDLKKPQTQGRSPEQEVRIIADKFPEMWGAPSTYHGVLCMRELLGRPIPLEGRIPLMHGRAAAADGLKAILYSRSPEEEAFSRWQRGEFLEVERRYAAMWRKGLSVINLQEISHALRKSGVGRDRCRTLADARDMATSLRAFSADPAEALGEVVDCVNMPRECRGWVFDCWRNAGALPVSE